MKPLGRKALGEWRRACVGRELDAKAAPRQCGRKRFGREQVTGRAAGREQNGRAARLGGLRLGQAGLPAGRACSDAISGATSTGAKIAAAGRSRASASSMPMPYASEINEDPP